MNPIKTYRIEAKFAWLPNPFVDWVDATTMDEAEFIWRERALREGAEPDDAELSIREATEREAAIFSQI